VIHWVDADKNAKLTVNLYERLFTDEAPDSGNKNFLDLINPNSLAIKTGCLAEIGLAKANPEDVFQFEREGYFCRDNQSTELVFNQTISLRDTFNG